MITATKPDPPRLFPPSPAYSPLPNFEFRVSNFAFLPLSPFPATLTRNQHFCRKTASVSPLFATLTDAPSRKSFPCHSCENMGGVPSLVPASTSRRPRNPLTPLESALTDSSSRKSFRIRSYEKHRGGTSSKPKKSRPFLSPRRVLSPVGILLSPTLLTTLGWLARPNTGPLQGMESSL